MYQKIVKIASRFLEPSTIFKWGFNLSPMYRRTTARVMEVSENLHEVRVKIPINYKNRNVAGSIFGGTLYAAADPISMIQFMWVLGEDYVVWDKSAEINFKIPAREDVYIKFEIDYAVIDNIKEEVAKHKKYHLPVHLLITNKAETKVYCVVNKVIYIAEKEYYLERKRAYALNII